MTEGNGRKRKETEGNGRKRKETEENGRRRVARGLHALTLPDGLQPSMPALHVPATRPPRTLKVVPPGGARVEEETSAFVAAQHGPEVGE